MLRETRERGAAIAAGVEAVGTERARALAADPEMPAAQLRLLLHAAAHAAVEPLQGTHVTAMAACSLEGREAGGRSKKMLETRAVQYKDAHPLCEKCDGTTRRSGGKTIYVGGISCTSYY